MEETTLLTQLVADLQELSLAEAGELRLILEDIALEPLIRGAVEALRPQAEARSVRLEIDLSGSLPLVKADAGRTAQILRNLLSNSMTHTPRNGRITISASPVDAPSATRRSPPATPFVQIQIEDNGAGIEADHQDQVFERFYRADAARGRTTGGSGLGLAICKLLVEAQGGEIWLKSVLGEGTAVTFTLPQSG